MKARGLLTLLMATTCKLVLDPLGARVVEATVFLKPSLTNFIINVPVTVECYTHESGYLTLSFSFNSSSNHTINHVPSHITYLNDGGLRGSTTFTMTAELNGTKVVCAAAAYGRQVIESQPATIYVQEVPSQMDSFRYCKLPGYLFFNWTSVFTLNGIAILYNITDNLQIKTIDVPHYSVPLRSGSYQANITVIVYATAANQIAYEAIPEIIVPDTQVSLNLSEISVYKENTIIKLNFTVQLDHLNEGGCLFNTLTSGKLIVCMDNDSKCSNFSATIEYGDRKLNFHCKVNISTLSGRRFQSRLCFEYLGEEIETNNITTSLYDLQDIKFITENCLNIHMIRGWSTPTIYLLFTSGEKTLKHQVNVSDDIFVLCSPIAYNKTHNISFSYGEDSETWNLKAYENHLMKEEPAVKLHNITIKLMRLKETPPFTEFATEGTERVPTPEAIANASTIKEARVGIIMLLLFVSIMVFIIA